MLFYALENMVCALAGAENCCCCWLQHGRLPNDVLVVVQVLQEHDLAERTLQQHKVLKSAASMVPFCSTRVILCNVWAAVLHVILLTCASVAFWKASKIFFKATRF
jgi:hypothetical protein